MQLKETFIILILIECLINVKLSAAQRPKAKLYSLDENSVRSEWLSFKTKHNKIFRNQVADTNRLKIFKENLKTINQQNEKYNNGTSDYTYGVNRFTDMTSDEFLKYVNKGISIKDEFESLANASSTLQYKSNRLKRSLPTSVDWRTQGYVNPIKNQGTCGSCWSFSSVSTIESQYFKTNGALLKFSEQQLVDCAYLSQNYSGSDADGCQGGFMTDAFDYIKKYGLALETSYPYTSAKSGVWAGSCKYSAASAAAQLSGYVVVTNRVGNEALLTDAIANQGPITVAMYATSAFQYYSTGVFTDTTCPKSSINHAVTLVGYGTASNGQDYYILRNSWGTTWGDGGYMLYRRNNDNQCSISSYASYPIVKPIDSVSTTRAGTTTSSSSRSNSTQPPVTTTQPTTTSPSAKTAKCYNGTGYYADSGCQTGYYCSLQITKYQCLNGYLFDVASDSCKPPSQVTCNPLPGLCPNGTDYYTYPGCQYLYYCRQRITNLKCNSGFLFNPENGLCYSARTYTCPF